MSQIIVLCGGSSDEREVSLRSGKAVAASLELAGYSVKIIDPADEDFSVRQPTIQQADAVFPVLHGAGGEDGEIQKLLESWQVKFVGSDSASSALCFDKWRYKKLMLDNGILMPRGELVDFEGFKSSVLISQPFVLKPYDGGSSVDTLIISDSDDFDISAAEKVFARHPKMLLEELIQGTEITVGILDNEPLPVIEIIPPENGQFDYENKYNGKTQELCPPQNVSQNAQEKAQEIALKVHKLCGCRDLSRTDFIVTNEDEVYLLETNTMPGMTGQSLFPKASLVSGLPMPEVTKMFVEMAINRK